MNVTSYVIGTRFPSDQNGRSVQVQNNVHPSRVGKACCIGAKNRLWYRSLLRYLSRAFSSEWISPRKGILRTGIF